MVLFGTIESFNVKSSIKLEIIYNVDSSCARRNLWMFIRIVYSKRYKQPDLRKITFPITRTVFAFLPLTVSSIQIVVTVNLLGWTHW